MKRTHGLSRTSMFKLWHSMISRCRNKNHISYHRYGGRGIAVCDRWKTFVNFLEDMGDRPAGSTLDRIDNDGPYSPENCRWATRKQQAKNSSRPVVLMFNGMSMNMNEWDMFLGLSLGHVGKRIKRGWSLERALSTPGRGKK